MSQIAVRSALVIALVTVLAEPALAQTHLADSSGVFIGGDTSLGYGGRSAGVIGDVQAMVGYRQANGLDYSLRAAGSSNSTHRQLTISPTLGYTHALSERSWLRTEAGVLATLGEYESSPFSTRSYSVSTTSLAAVASAGLGRSYHLTGSLAFSPSVSAYGRVGQITSWDVGGPDGPALFGDQDGDWSADVGLRFDLPVSFRLLGQDVTLTVSPEIPLFGGRSGLPARGGIRINF